MMSIEYIIKICNNMYVYIYTCFFQELRILLQFVSKCNLTLDSRAFILFMSL